MVPDGDKSWPSVAWGYRLGTAVNRLRQRGRTSRCPQNGRGAGKNGFHHEHATKQMGDYHSACFAALPNVHNHTDVPAEFVVPTGDDAWPKLAWGYCLGNAVNDIRHGNVYTAQVARCKKELDEVEFCIGMSIVDRDWEEKVLPSTRVYRQAFGGCIILQSFVVSSSAPWPEKAWGKPTLSVMRSQGTYFAHYGRDIDKLDELGANLKLLPRAWNKRVAPLLTTYAELHGRGKVQEDFVIASEAPWKDTMWDVRLGLIVARNTHFGPRYLVMARWLHTQT